jgi:hypothetical protein
VFSDRAFFVIKKKCAESKRSSTSDDLESPQNTIQRSEEEEYLYNKGWPCLLKKTIDASTQLSYHHTDSEYKISFVGYLFSSMHEIDPSKHLTTDHDPKNNTPPHMLSILRL